jgi:stage V sporulation protein T
VIVVRATGIVRRIDDLGRIAIPKEVRRIIGVKEGDPLEIFTDEGGIFIKPYHPDILSELKSALVRLEDNADHPDQWKLINEMQELVRKYEKI